MFQPIDLVRLNVSHHMMPHILYNSRLPLAAEWIADVAVD